MDFNLVYINFLCCVLYFVKIFQALGASYKKQVILGDAALLVVRELYAIVHFLKDNRTKYLDWAFNLFYKVQLNFGRIKVTELGNRIVSKGQKKFYSSKIKFTDTYKQQVHKDLLKKRLTNDQYKYWKKEMDLIHQHPITINNIKSLNNVDCRIEYINNTTKNKDVIINNQLISVEQVGQNINNKFFQGMPKIVYSKVVKKDDLKNGKLLEDDTRFFEFEKEQLIKNEIIVLNNDKSVKSLDLDNLKITDFNGNFSVFQTFIDFLKSIK